MPAKKNPAKKVAARKTSAKKIVSDHWAEKLGGSQPSVARPPEATAHIEKEHWLASEENRAELDRILKNPVFLAAVHYVTEQNRLSTAILSVEAMPDNVIARRAAAHAGCVEFVAGLRNLVKAKAIPYTPEPYSHIESPYK